MLILRNVPDLRNASFWEHQSSAGNRSMNIIIWPADDGPKLVRVRVGLTALEDYGGHSLGLDNAKIEASLEGHRDLIQRLAQAKYRAGDDRVTLDIGDFRTP